MFTVGLTGGIGSGKSTVAGVFGVLGVPVFVSDAEGRRLLDEEADVQARVGSAFPSVRTSRGVDRKALAAIVFADPAALARLNAIMHPAVREAFRRWREVQRTPYVINEAAILVETGGHQALDHLVVVTAPEEERIARVMARDGVTEEQVRARLRNQATDGKRNLAADTIITNDGRSLVIPQVLALHERLLQLSAR